MNPRHPHPAASFSRASLAAGVKGLTERFTRMAGDAPNPDAGVAATPAWTVRDVTAHLITTVARYAAGPAAGMERVADPADLPSLNQRLLERHREPMPALLARLRQSTGELLAQIEGYGDEQPSYMFNGGRPVRADRALGILVGELAVHGHDVAAATGQPWPLTAADAEMTLHGLEQVLPGWLHPQRSRGHTACYSITVRGGQHRHTWAFHGGHLDCHASRAGPFDCHLSASPGALLMVMYRRTAPLRAALTGGAFARGRRPWLALSLPGRFHLP